MLVASSPGLVRASTVLASGFLSLTACTASKSRQLSESDNDKVVVTHHSSDGRSKSFTTENPEGGFITMGGKLYFATRDATMLTRVLDAIGLPAAAGEVKAQEAYLPDGWHVYDVNQPKAIDPKIMAVLGRRSTYEGPRCYSAVLYGLGQIEGPINISDRAFRNWALSSIAQEIKGTELKAGDVIAVGEKPTQAVPLDHVALVLENGLIFQKANPSESSPFELLTQESFDHRYAGQFFKYYRPITSFASYYESIRLRLPTKAQELLAKLQDYERGLPPYFLTHLDEPDFPWDLEEARVAKWQEDYKRYYDEASDFGMTEEAYAQAQLVSVGAADQDLRYFWTQLEERLRNLYAQGTPFD
jgi:hypothetical protein